MVKWLMRRGIAAFERQWNYDASYVREIIEVSPRAAWMFSRAAAIGGYRKDVPMAAWALGVGICGLAILYWTESWFFKKRLPPVELAATSASGSRWARSAWAKGLSSGR